MLNVKIVLNNIIGSAAFDLFKASDPVCVTRIFACFLSSGFRWSLVLGARNEAYE